ncbi:MaoC family dehydratase [Microbulbifer sp. ZKSA004]|uniref:MaoC family dehydratase n=1 Tax=unclassified Microbulbifer TaxID=2619833 RepID=UPI00403959B2
MSLIQDEMMDVLEYIREKERLLRARINNLDLKSTHDNHLHQLSYYISNLLKNSWTSKAGPVVDPASNRELQVIKNPKAIAFYQDWQARIGQQIYIGRWIVVDQSRIDSFAEVTGDRQWIHIDPERARAESPFGGTIAHGFLVLSLIPELTDTVNPEKPPYPEARMIINCGLEQVRFPYPVKTGNRIRARTTLKSLVPSKRSVEMINHIEVEVEGSGRMVCVADSVLKLYF